MNPFLHGNPVISTHFLGRKKELRRASQRIYSSQSIAIVSEPRTGKTSLLLYLAALENRSHLYAEAARAQRIFSYLDALAFDDEINQTRFWTLALAPIFSADVEPNTISQLTNLYQIALNNNFNYQSLAALFDEQARQQSQLVLLIDEFDMLLNFPGLCCSEFLGSLRSLASIKPALSLVIATRQSITRLNLLTQQLNPTGSPYFNTFEECVLSPFAEPDVELLLGRANGRFSPEDIAYITHAAGSHPYFLQVIAAELWNIYEDGDETDPEQRRYRAGQALLDVAAHTIGNTWSAWQPQMRMAITVVALAKNPNLVDQRFNNDGLLRDLRDFGPELRAFEKQGYIKKAENSQINADWQIIPAVFQWWLAEELVRTVRNDADFAKWLQAQEWDGLLTTKEKNQLLTTGKFLLDLVKGGILKQFKMD